MGVGCDLPPPPPPRPQAQPTATIKLAQPGSQHTQLGPSRTLLRGHTALLLLLSGTMRSLWLCWALWALPLTGPGAAVTEEQILSSLLQQLHLSEVPVLDKSDVEELVTPAHVRAQYVALLRRSHGAPSRGKRFSQNFRGEASLPAAP